MSPTTPPAPTAESDTGRGRPPGFRALLARISLVEKVAAGIAAAVLAVLVVIEPDILEAPFASPRAVLFTFGGTALAALALVAMLRANVPPPVRLAVLGIPFVAVQWWLLSPYFTDTVVEDTFEASIADQQAAVTEPPPTTAPTPGEGSAPPPTTAAPPPPAGPQLLGAGSFVGLAGHEGTGDAGIFRLEDGSQVLRLENFDIENGPDLELYLVPGRDRTDLAEGSIHLGPLRGNVGDQTYQVPGAGLPAGDWTVLVWCEAFAVEFVGASVTLD